jgi:coenzyme F420-0:L-glutamate ligase / coenzyme F420-1:gamma-L-glutamate ligase
MAEPTAESRRVLIQAIAGMPEVRPGDDLAALILAALAGQGVALADGDVLAVAQKIVSKAEGRLVELASVAPGPEARRLSAELGKPAAKVQLILDESTAVIRTAPPGAGREGVLIVRHRCGFICANAGIDESNAGRDGLVVLLPRDPDASAAKLRDRIAAATGRHIGIVVTDSFGRPWRLGLVSVAIGLAGLPALTDLIGTADAHGRILTATLPAFADEIAAASGLVVGKASQTPVCLFRGLAWDQPEQPAAALVRPAKEDLFL